MRLFDQLRLAPARLADTLDLFQPSSLRWRPSSWEESPAEHFSALEHICHLRDIEVDGYYVRFQRLLREEQPELPSLDSYQLAQERKYQADSAQNALEAFAYARMRTVALLGDHWPQRTRRGSFAGFGAVDVEGLAHLLVSHDMQHLAGLHWLHARYRTNA